jgi:hypothetical protein
MPNSRDRYVRTSFAVAPPRCASAALKTASRSATVGACLRCRALGAWATGAVLAGRSLLRLSIVPGVFPNRVSTRSAISSSLSSFASVALSAPSRASCSETRCLSRPISSDVAICTFPRSLTDHDTTARPFCDNSRINARRDLYRRALSATRRLLSGRRLRRDTGHYGSCAPTV